MAYLNLPEVREVIGIDATFNFSLISLSVNAAFASRLDDLDHSTSAYASALLERGIKILFYVGNYDLMCNWISVEKWTRALEWHGQAEFNVTPLREWNVDGKRAGLTRSFKGLTFATVEGAGHMVSSFEDTFMYY